MGPLFDALEGGVELYWADEPAPATAARRAPASRVPQHGAIHWGQNVRRFIGVLRSGRSG